MPNFDTSNPDSLPKVIIEADQVLAVTFSEAAQSTVIELKPGELVVMNDGKAGFQTNLEDDRIAVKGAVEEVKTQLGL